MPRTRALERRIVTARENCTMEVLRTRLLKMNGSILKRSRMRPPTLRSFENFSTCTVLFSRTLTFYKYIQLTKPSYSSMLADIETQVVEWVQQLTYPRVGKTSRSYKDILITMLAGNSEKSHRARLLRICLSSTRNHKPCSLTDTNEDEKE